MKRTGRRLVTAVGLVSVLVALYWHTTSGLRVFSAATPSAARQTGAVTPPTTNLVEILPADALDTVLDAVGTIELAATQQVVLQVNGEIQTLAVRAGDHITAGAVVATIDPGDLARAVAKAEVEVEVARLELSKQANEADQEKLAAELALAEATLLAANEQVAKVKRGPSAEELAAAQSNVNANWAKYNSLLAAPSADKLTALKANLQKAEIDLQEAQRAYDSVAWQNDVGMTPEAARLQKATIDYERVKAEFAQANQPAAQAEQLAALSAAQKAEDELKRLQQRPTPAELAEAQAKVAEAAAKVARLRNNPADLTIKNAELRVKKALIELDEAQHNLRQAQILAPISGTILEVKVKVGERATAGALIATIGDPQQLRLTTHVAEVDVNQISAGQKVTITLDALAGQRFSGLVERVAFLGQTKRDVINYPVTIQLVGAALQGIRPGMTAVATFEQKPVASYTWLAPTNALHTEAGQSVVVVMRHNVATPIVVTPGATQGEWIYITAPALQAGDLVVGNVISFVDQQAEAMFGG